ncbi:MAG: PPOX class F420-dependent oxidoreductase [Frankia sp.]|nr:PPOX class F420-dependent oxidoreductase [Frankia sp.]
MTAELSAEVRGWLDAASFATVATLNADGHPQLSVVWVERDGNVIVFSTVVGRRKERNLRRDPRATMLVSLADPYRYAEVRGRVTITEDGGSDLIDRLSLKYRGVTPYLGDRGTDNVRVVVRLTPERVFFYE